MISVSVKHNHGGHNEVKHKAISCEDHQPLVKTFTQIFHCNHSCWFFVICCRRTIPSTRAILWLVAFGVVSITSSCIAHLLVDEVALLPTCWTGGSTLICLCTAALNHLEQKGLLVWEWIRSSQWHLSDRCPGWTWPTPSVWYTSPSSPLDRQSCLRQDNLSKSLLFSYFPKTSCWDILMKTCFMAAILQNASYWTLGNFVYLIAHTTRFRKMYSFHTFQRNLAEILTKTCFMAAILWNARWRPYWTRGNVIYLIAHTIRFPKMYSFHTFQRNLAEILTKTYFMVAIL